MRNLFFATVLGSVTAAFLCAMPARAIDFFGIEVDGAPAAPANSMTPTTPGTAGPAVAPLPSAPGRPLTPGKPLAAQATAVGTFGGIPWGTKLEAVQSLVQGWGDLQQTEMIPGKRLMYRGGTFGGIPIDQWGMDFQQDKLYRGAVVLEKQGEGRKQFDQVKALLLKRYGNFTSQEGKSPSVVYQWTIPAGIDRQAKRVRCAFNAGEHSTKLVFINDTIRNAVGVFE